MMHATAYQHVIGEMRSSPRECSPRGRPPSNAHCRQHPLPSRRDARRNGNGGKKRPLTRQRHSHLSAGQSGRPVEDLGHLLGRRARGGDDHCDGCGRRSCRGGEEDAGVPSVRPHLAATGPMGGRTCQPRRREGRGRLQLCSHDKHEVASVCIPRCAAAGPAHHPHVA